jgi:hypothetical protein
MVFPQGELTGLANSLYSRLFAKPASLVTLGPYAQPWSVTTAAKQSDLSAGYEIEEPQ